MSNYAVVGSSEDGRLCHDGIGWIDADAGDFIHYFQTQDEALEVLRREEEKQKNLPQGRWIFRMRVVPRKA